jgi:hypothetical protein
VVACAVVVFVVWLLLLLGVVVGRALVIIMLVLVVGRWRADGGCQAWRAAGVRVLRCACAVGSCRTRGAAAIRIHHPLGARGAPRVGIRGVGVGRGRHAR